MSATPTSGTDWEAAATTELINSAEANPITRRVLPTPKKIFCRMVRPFAPFEPDGLWNLPPIPSPPWALEEIGAAGDLFGLALVTLEG